MGPTYDRERTRTRRGAESQSVSTRHYGGQEGHACGRVPTGTPSRIAQVGYPHPPCDSRLIGELLFQQSPKDKESSKAMACCSIAKACSTAWGSSLNW